MNTMLDRLFVTPISWLLAVPIVLLDRVMTPELNNRIAGLEPSPGAAARCRPLRTELLATSPSCQRQSESWSWPTFPDDAEHLRFEVADHPRRTPSTTDPPVDEACAKAPGRDDIPVVVSASSGEVSLNSRVRRCLCRGHRGFCGSRLSSRAR